MRDFESPYLKWIKKVEMPRLNLGMSGLHYTGKFSDLDTSPGEEPVSVHHGYGLEEYLAALSLRYGVPQDNIVSSIGTSGANFLLFIALLSPGDEVIVETPVYDPLPNALKLSGAEVKYVPRRRENGWRIDLDEFQSLLSGETRMAVLTNLHNPSGVLIPDEDLRAMAQIMGELGGWLLVDEVYLEFYFGKGPKTSFLLADNILVTSSLTKAFGLGPLRAGWIFAPGAAANVLRDAFDLAVGTTPSFTEHIAARVLGEEALFESFAGAAEELMRENLPVVEEFVNSTAELDWVKPDGGVSAFLLTESSDKAEKLQRLLFEGYRTLVMPGRFFEYPRGFRLGYGIPGGILKEGLENIRRALREL